MDEYGKREINVRNKNKILKFRKRKECVKTVIWKSGAIKVG